MYTVFTVEEATILLTVLSSLVVPFIVSYLKRSSWPSYAKYLLAAGVSLAAGYLTVITTTQMKGITSTVILGSLILSAAQFSYKTWFKGLGLEDWFNPPEENTQKAAEHAGDIVEEAVRNAVDDAVDDATKDTL
jgi:hypothetical protein